MLKIITAYNKTYKPLIDISSPCVLNYCHYHGFGYEAYQIPEDYIRPAPWAKIQYLITNLEEKIYDYILWVDADTIIKNPTYDLLSIIDPSKYIYISRDFNNINTGVILFKNNTYNLNLLYQLWGMTDYLNHSWWEQGALVNLIDQNWRHIQQRMKYIPNKEFNGYLPEISSNPAYQADDNTFIVHFPSSPLEFRIHSMKKIAQEYAAIYRKDSNLLAFRYAKDFISSWQNMKLLSIENGNKYRSELCDIMLFRFLQNLKT
jgi:lipopolysaccharide biosynthesis glycosyltransferase